MERNKIEYSALLDTFQEAGETWRGNFSNTSFFFDGGKIEKRIFVV